MKTGRIVLLLLAAIFSVGADTRFAEAAKTKTLDVAVVLRLNDKFNDTVAAMTTGIETAKIMFEAANPGVKIVLHRYPHGEDLESVVLATTRLMNDKIPAVIGGELSEESFVLRDKLSEKKIVFVTPTSSNPAVTEGYPYAFRACFSDRLVAGQLANLVIDHLKPSAVGVMHNVSSPYTDFLSKQFLETFNERMAVTDSKKRVPIVEQKVLRDTMDFDSQIKFFMEKKVTHLAMLTHQSDLLRFALQAANKGFFPVYVGSDGWGSNEHVHKNLVRESPQGSKFVAFRNSYWKEDATTPMATKFKKVYSKVNPTREPTAWSAISFDAAWILFSAMSKAKNPRDGDQIREQMLAIKRLKLVTSENFAFGSDNSPRKDLYIYRLDKGGIKHEVTLK